MTSASVIDMCFIRFLQQAFILLFIPSVLFAQSGTLSATTDNNDLRAQTITANTIILCSNMPNLSPSSLEGFAQEALDTDNLPNIIAGNEPFSDKSGTTVYFYFGFSEKEGQNFEIDDCLNAFPPLTETYSEILGGLAEGIGIKPNFLPNPELYTPIVVRLKTIYENDALVVLYLGLQGSHFPHVTMAYQYLFGLPDTFCQTAKNCPEVDEIEW